MPNLSKNRLSEWQEHAINHFTGPALVVAGPGSGKTTVIVNRINNLIYQRHIKPENILVITFSKMAALSMQSRFQQTGSYLPVTFGTFHSVFYNIIRQSQTNQINVISIRKKQEILTDVLQSLNISDNLEKEFLNSLLKRISYYKNSNLKKDNKSLCNIDEKTFMSVFDAYCENLRIMSLIDFDDMMLLCKKNLINNSEIRKRYQDMFKFVLIDEFQDINDLQFEIIKLLINDENNIFAVGDDDQSIYGFRGSNPTLMSKFSEYFPTAELIYLSCNYRCAKEITYLSNKLIGNNTMRIPKDIVSDKANGKAAILSFESGDKQNEEILNYIENKSKTGNMCLLYRNNISVSRMIEYLVRNNIDCECVEKTYNPFDTVIVKDFLVYYKLSRNDEICSKEFVRIMNKPLRYLSRNKIIGDHTDLTLLKGLYKDKTYVVEKIKKLEYDLKFMRKMDLYSAFHYFRKVIGYEEYAKNSYSDFNKNYGKDYFDLIGEKLRDYNDYDKLKNFIISMDSVNKEKEQIVIVPGKIYVMTYHASKGLEFDSVWIPDLMEGECPSSKSQSAEDIEEERRMLYVAMTRAKSELTMSYILGNSNKKLLKSRFVHELEK